MVCGNNVSILHNFLYTTTFTVYVTACNLEKYSGLEKNSSV